MSSPNPVDSIKTYKVLIGQQDISLLIKKVSIDQSIYQQFMTCIIEYQDTKGIFTEAMSGQDVTVSITPVYGAPLNCKFVLDYIDNAVISTSGYHTSGVARCISKEYLYAKSEVVTKPFDKTSGEAVRDIMLNYFKTSKTIDADQGIKLPDVVLANHQKPHEVIEKLSRYEGEPYYSFETPSGFKWKKKSSLAKQANRYTMNKTQVADLNRALGPQSKTNILYASFQSTGQSMINNERAKDRMYDPTRDTTKETQVASQAKFSFFGPSLGTPEQKLQKPIFNTPEQYIAKRKEQHARSQQNPEMGTTASLMLPANFELEAGHGLYADLGPVGTGYTEGGKKNPWSNKYRVEKVAHVFCADGSEAWCRTFVTGVGM